MFVSNLPGSLQGAWGNAPFLQVNSPKIGILGQNTPAQDVLGRMSENLMDAQQQTSLRDRVELKFSGVLDTEYLIRAAKEFFSTGLKADGDGSYRFVS